MAAVNGELVEFHGHKTRNAQPTGIEELRSSYNFTNQTSRFIYCAWQGGTPREDVSSGKEATIVEGSAAVLCLRKGSKDLLLNQA